MLQTYKSMIQTYKSMLQTYKSIQNKRKLIFSHTMNELDQVSFFMTGFCIQKKKKVVSHTFPERKIKKINFSLFFIGSTSTLTNAPLFITGFCKQKKMKTIFLSFHIVCSIKINFLLFSHVYETMWECRISIYIHVGLHPHRVECSTFYNRFLHSILHYVSA